MPIAIGTYALNGSVRKTTPRSRTPRNRHGQGAAKTGKLLPSIFVRSLPRPSHPFFRNVQDLSNFEIVASRHIQFRDVFIFLGSDIRRSIVTHKHSGSPPLLRRSASISNNSRMSSVTHCCSPGFSIADSNRWACSQISSRIRQRLTAKQNFEIFPAFNSSAAIHSSKSLSFNGGGKVSHVDELSPSPIVQAVHSIPRQRGLHRCQALL